MAFGQEDQDFNSQSSVDPGTANPFIQDLLNFGRSALGQVGGLDLNNLIPGFNQDQEAGFSLARDVAGGGGGFVPMLQDLLRSTASGTDISEFLPSSAFDSVSQFAGGQGANINQTAQSALESIAGGDALYGSPGFDASVNAAIESAMPSVFSQFTNTAGGLSGASAKTELGKFGVREALAQQAAERNRQLAAAGQLSQLGQSDANRSLSASGLLFGEGSRERDRALNAARDLPGAGLLGANIRSDIGGQRRQLEQAQRLAPLDALSQIIQLVSGGTSGVSPLFGGNQSGRGRTTEFGLDQDNVSTFAGKF